MRILRFGEKFGVFGGRIQIQSPGSHLPIFTVAVPLNASPPPHYCLSPRKVTFLGEDWGADLSPRISSGALHPPHLSLCLQDVRPCDGGAGGGDRSLAHRHEGAQVSCLDHGSLLRGLASPQSIRLPAAHLCPHSPGWGGDVLVPLESARQAGGGRGRAKREGFDESGASPVCQRPPLPDALGRTRFPPHLPSSPLLPWGGRAFPEPLAHARGCRDPLLTAGAFPRLVPRGCC